MDSVLSRGTVRLTLAPPVMAPRRHQAGEPYQGMCVAEKIFYTPFSPLPLCPVDYNHNILSSGVSLCMSIGRYSKQLQ
jgi:hypothetical protein